MPQARCLKFHYVTALVAAIGLMATGAARSQTVTTVMSGLDNPRGLAIGPEGAIYVVEAGRGGDGPSVFARGDLRKYGPTGAVTRLWEGRQQRVATGLPSHIGQATGEVTGPHDISMLGRGQAYVTIGLGFDPLSGPPWDLSAFNSRAWREFCQVGSWRLEEDFGAYEIAENPDGVPLLNSNPYGLVSLPGKCVVVETGSNALVEVPASGGIETIAKFQPQSNPLFPGFGPPMMEAVPTSVVLGPDGALYVSQLTGFPFPAGSAGVFRIEADGQPQVYLTGFKTIIDLDFGPDGSLYVLQHVTGPVLSGPGVLIRVAPDGTRSTYLAGLDRPTSVLVGPDGAVYVSNRGTSVAVGEVLRITP